MVSRIKKATLITNKWMGACLSTQTDGLIRLMLYKLAPDDHDDINIMLANVIVVNRHLHGDSR